MKSRPLLFAALAVLAAAVWFAFGPRLQNRSTSPPPAAEVATAGTTSRPAAPAAGVESRPVAPLLQPRDELWEKPISEVAFAEFKEWTARYLAAPPAGRAALEAEGVRLATRRQRAMADTIMARPERALELAAPSRIRREMPASIRERLEEPVNARGHLNVAGVLPLEGRGGDTPAVVRSAEIGGETLAVFTFGKGLDYMTKRNVPLNGIALPATAATNPLEGPDSGAKKIMALAPNPVRELDADELADVIGGADESPECPTSGLEVAEQPEPAGGLLGGETFTFCGAPHLRDWATAAAGAAGYDQPGGTVGTASQPVAASAYTEGYKRFLYLRVKFPDATGVTISLSNAQTLHAEMMEYMARMSFDRHRLAPLGVGGSAITEELLMPQNVAYYDNAGLSRLYPDARAAAGNAGFDLGQFEFAAVFTGARPAAGYAGLAYVGGVGIHIANSYYGKGVLVHELGHNLGLWHAHRWDTGNATIVGTGTNDEYGNNFDPIGGATGDARAQYVGSYKMLLGWIPGADGARLTTSGLRRLYALDHRYGTQGLRTLRVARGGGGQDYFADYRGAWDDAKRDGLFLHFANSDGHHSYIVDALPRRGSNQDLLPIGRSFDDTATGVHITPVARFNTVPASVDVMVTLGNPPGNRAPVGRITSTHPAPAVNAPVTLRCDATDADGDALAYWWDFGDGTSSVDNQPVQTRPFPAGEYAVHCTISDMRGGLDRRSYLLQVGGVPATFRISGRVLDKMSKPLGGIYISTAGSQYAWSDTDGSYTLTRLPAGPHTLTARELTTGSLTVSRVFFTNPVTVGPSVTNADFNEPTNPPETLTPLIAKAAIWKYHDLGTDLGVSWRAAAFDDSTWATGPALLGYGNGGEGTIVSFGPDAANKRTTCYFRRHFNVANPATFEELRLEVKRDDGVIVYLNGTEIFRDNLPADPVTYATGATDQVEPDSFLLKSDIAPSLLVAGDNVLSAEVHQVEPTSSDLAFDLSLTGVAPSAGLGTAMAAISNVADGAIFTAPVPSIPLEATARADNAAVTKVEFFADNVKLGESTAAPFTWAWSNPTLGTHVLHVVATFSAGTPVTSGRVNVVVAGAPATLLARAAAQWRYLVGSSAPPVGWQGTAFNDATWTAGAAQLGFGESDEVTTLPSGQIAYYFRRSFEILDPAAVSQVRLRLLIDDGAVAYLNGVELVRSNIPAGAVTNTTLAISSATENVWEEYAVPAEFLRPGPNLLAVEVHQQAAGSSDVSFDAEVVALTTTPRPRSVVAIVPATTVQPAPVALAALALPGAGRGVVKVEFFADGQKIGEDTSYPWAFEWSGAALGRRSITARATDTAALTFGSAPVATQVIAPEAMTALVSFNELWRYLDTGLDPGDWTGRTGFDDSSWAQGQARFGYGDDGEVTTVGHGALDAEKHVTTWFRKKFNVTDPAAFGALLVRLIRDDGARVFLNRTEIVRDSLPPGVITFATLATASIANAAETTPVEFVVPTTALRAGENQLAVEIHQQAASSSDLGFDLSLLGLKSPAPPAGVYLTSPAAGEQIHPGSGVKLTAATFAAGPVSRVEFYVGGAKIGEDLSAPFSFTWPAPLVGSYSLTARAVTSGGTITSAAVAVNVTAPLVHDVVIAGGSVWKYRDDGALPAGAWTGLGYDDAGWKSGNARLGFGNDGEVTTITPGAIAYYLRRPFTIPAVGAFTGSSLRVQRDDGLVLYLDGVEIARLNLPGGAVTNTTLASSSISGTAESAWIDVPLPTAALTPGNHVLAAEVHQADSTSSDVGFNAILTLDYTAPGGVYNTPPLVTPATTLTSPAVGAMQFGFAEQDGRVYQLEWSDDLVTWTVGGTAIASGGRIDWSVATSGLPQRFFRARWVSAP